MQVPAIQFVRDYPGHPVGTVTDAIPPGVADTLVHRGVATRVVEGAAPATNDNSPPGPPSRATNTGGRRKQVRP